MSIAYTHVAVAAQRPALLRVDRLSIGFRVNRSEVLPATRAVSFAVAPESVVALVGESGSGKSVSALAIMGLLPKESAVIGRDSGIYYNGINLLFAPPAQVRALRGKEIAMIFQEPMSALNPVIRVGEQIEEVLRAHLRMSQARARGGIAQ
jgi:peptide/nickel transport system ATP-binding protein